FSRDWSSDVCSSDLGEYPTGQVEGGAVTGAEEAALPVCRQPRARASRQLGCRRTAQVSTDAHCNEVFRIARTVFVFSVGGGEAGPVRVGVSKTGVQFRQRCQLSFRATQYPYRLAAPFHSGHLAGL